MMRERGRHRTNDKAPPTKMRRRTLTETTVTTGDRDPGDVDRNHHREDDPSSSCPSSSSDGRRKEEGKLSNSSACTALVPYVVPPPPRHRSDFDETVFLNGVELRTSTNLNRGPNSEKDELTVTAPGTASAAINSKGPELESAEPPNLRLCDDIVPTVLSYCDARTLSRASCVCAEWRNVARSDDLWENLCRERFGVSADEIRPRPDPTKLLYVLNHRRLREVCRTNVNPFTGRTRTGGGMGSMRTIPFTVIGGS